MSSGITTSRRCRSVGSDELQSRNRKHAKLGCNTPIKAESPAPLATDIEDSKVEHGSSIEITAREPEQESEVERSRMQVVNPGLGDLGRLSPEIRDLIYELIPVEDDPEIASPCQPHLLHCTSASLSRDLHRLRTPCTHVNFKLTCDASSAVVAQDRYGWCRGRLAQNYITYKYDNTIHRIDLAVKNSTSPELPTLCYRIVQLQHNILHVWFNGARANHARLRQYREALVGSFDSAAACIIAILGRMCHRLWSGPDFTMDPIAVRRNVDKLSILLRYYAAAQVEERENSADRFAQCFFVSRHPIDDSVEFHFNNNVFWRLQTSGRSEPCSSTFPFSNEYEPPDDQFQWHHGRFDCEKRM